MTIVVEVPAIVVVDAPSKGLLRRDAVTTMDGNFTLVPVTPSWAFKELTLIASNTLVIGMIVILFNLWAVLEEGSDRHSWKHQKAHTQIIIGRLTNNI